MSSFVVDPIFKNIELPNPPYEFDLNLSGDITDRKNNTHRVNVPAISRLINNDAQFANTSASPNQCERNEKLSIKPNLSEKANSHKIVPIHNLDTSNSENYNISRY